MFSGLTSQVTNWMGKKPGDPGNETDPSNAATEPGASRQVPEMSEAEKTDFASPTKGGAGRSEIFSNVKNQVSQMSTWLGGAMRRGEGEGGTGGAEVLKGESKPESPTSEKSEKGSPEEQQKDDDDSRYRATGGADSEPQVSEGEGTPTDDKDKTGASGAGLEQVSTKAMAGAQKIGSFFFSAVNKAGKTFGEAGAKIKKSVEENSILGDFNREQEAFIKDKQGKGSDAAGPPWVGYPDEETLKEEILSLSTDRRNFVRSPPEGVHFQFDFESSYPVALATLAVDPNLEKMRFELVPKVVNEETFWRNYFYRVSLIRQSNELSSITQEGVQGSKDSSRASSMEEAKDSTTEIPDPPPDRPPSEFISDSYNQPGTKEVNVAVQDGMKKLGMKGRNA